MTNSRGVFILRDVRRKELLGTWVDLDNVWIDTSIEESYRFSDNIKSYNTGYFGGGEGSSNAGISTMDKVTYSTDTTAAVPTANIIPTRSQLAATSSRANGLPQPPAPIPTPQTVPASPHPVPVYV